MVQSVLGSLTLGYRPLWGRTRQLLAVQLYVHTIDEGVALNLPHLLRTLREIWSESSPPLLLSPQQPDLLLEFLKHAHPGAPWMEVQGPMHAGSASFGAVTSLACRLPILPAALPAACLVYRPK